MCGRISLIHSTEEIHRRFKVDVQIPSDKKQLFTPRYNVFPSSNIPCIIQTNKGRGLSFMKWGLVPSWSKDETTGYKMMNARAETIAEKPSFREAFNKRRCIIPVSGFYEWKKSVSGDSKQPYYFKMDDGEIMPLAGLWEQWRDKEGGVLHSCTIITTPADKNISSIHHRMPVILEYENENLWLCRNSKRSTLENILKSNSVENIHYYPVSKLCNSANNDMVEREEAEEERAKETGIKDSIVNGTSGNWNK